MSQSNTIGLTIEFWNNVGMYSFAVEHGFDSLTPEFEMISWFN